ncbi:MAG: bifunctional lysylphosphatidylglycerol synthetase/lysine--tRNA ligase LysX [Micromonosporaceae bacterium]
MAVITSPPAAAQRRPSGPPRRERPLLTRVPATLATLFAIAAWTCALLALVPLLRDRSEPVQVAAAYLAIPIRPNLAYAAFLGLVAASLRRRTRLSWWIVVALYFGPSFLGSLVAGFVEPPVFISAAILFVLLAPTLAARREFTARLEPGNGWRALGTLVTGLVLASALALLLVWWFPGTLTTFGDRLTWAVNHVLGGLGTGMSLAIVGRPPAAVTFVCGLFGGLAFLAAAWVLFRPTRSHAYLSPEQERQIRDLIAANGEQDSLGYFATRRDKAAIFSPSGKAAVSYRVVFGTSLASGDPIGDPEAWPQAITAWLREAQAYAWTPAVLGASEEGALAYQRAGLDALQLGDEAIVETAEFSLDGRAMRGVRQAVRRIEKAGYRSRIRRHADLSPEEMAAVLARADAWRDTANERGFSMALGRLGDPADGQCVLVEALDAAGELRALLSFVPWGRSGLSLDLMRRDRDSDNGLVEFMVVQLIAAARRLAVARISLNFAMFREVFEEGGRIGAGPVIRLCRSVLLFVSRWWQLESLYRSNAKYRPDWEPRLLCFRRPRDLARISVAMGIAEGFVTVPTLVGLLRRGRAASAAPGAVQPVSAAEPLPAARPATVATIAAGTGDAGEADWPEQMRVRRRKLDRLRADGVDPYPVGFARTTTIGEIRAGYAGLAPGSRTGVEVAVAGRVMLNRSAGRLWFATVQDGTGRLQVMLSAERVGEAALHRWSRDIDLGDHVGVRGEVVASRKGELSVDAREWTLTAKCLRPLPDKHRGLHDPETRVRLRAVDLITNPAARRMLRVRSQIVAAVREFLTARDFVEVETPMLQRVHGGANARPFLTHSNAYDLRLYLRIAPELYLKRLLVGGEERVFELNRCFRNEGVDSTHNPEFTMLEAYQTYIDYDGMRALAQALIQHAAIRAFGAPVARRLGSDGTGHEVDLSGDWPVRGVHEAVSAALGEAVDSQTPASQLARLADPARVRFDPAGTAGQLVLELYEQLVEGRTVEPTFYRDFPADVSPLTRRHRGDARLAERWDLVAFGTELGTAYTELNDPLEQRERLTAQARLAAGGDPEAMEVDEDFLTALEYAMPPAGGLGLGVDRLLMMLTGTTIREGVLFPLVRPHT